MRRLVIIILCLGPFVAGCASKKSAYEVMEERNASAKPHPATYSSDGFYYGLPSGPDRDSKGGDFFYKRCQLVGRSKTAPSRSEWECTGPQ